MNWLLVIGALALSGLAVGIVLLLAAGWSRRVRPWAFAVALSALAFPAAIVLHEILSALIVGEEGYSFVLALVVAPAALAVGAIGGGLVLSRDPDQVVLGSSVLLTGIGLALFELYALFAIAVTVVEGGNPPYQLAVESLVVPVAALAAVAGAVSSVVVLATGPTRRPRTA